MRFLPVFLDLRAGPVLLIGQGEPARAKLRLLTSAGAEVRWHAPDGDYEAGPNVGGAVAIVDGDPLTIDLAGFVAIVCAGAGELGHAVSERARRIGLPVNVMDEPEHSTFIVPAIVDRGDVVVAIGTGGTAPVLARRLREKIEAVLPARIGELAAFIGRWRKRLAPGLPDHVRRPFWEDVVDGPIGAAVLEGREADAERALAERAAAPAEDRSARGFVTLVGAGPGDPDLLTVKALRALQDADVVFHDELVSPAVLDRVRRDAARVNVGRRVGQPGIGQDAIHGLLIAAARRGQRVVRLKGGDPYVFGRGGEEAAALRGAGIPYAVVPGITAALGASSAFDVPLTFRGQALRITFLTAHKSQDAEAIDWRALTDERMTVVVYMGMSAAAAVQAGLLAAGRSPTTPVGVFARVTQPDQQAAVGVLADLPSLVARIDKGPAVLVIGEVVTHCTPWRDSNSSELFSSLGIAAE